MRPIRSAVLLPLVLAVAAAAPGGGDSAAAATVKPYVAVSANRLVNASGETIRLLGVDRSGAEYMCLGGSGVFDGPVDGKAVKAMAAWRIDAVRVPLNEDCWLGINGVSAQVGGAAYRKAIRRYVQTLESHGLVAILDLHWAAPGAQLASSQWPMADADHAPAFWASVAKTFKANHGVIFDLFNEPYISSWPCWLEGCTTSYEDAGSDVELPDGGHAVARRRGARAPARAT